MRILLVDDARSARTPLEILLKSKGYILSTADDGAEALDLCRNSVFDLLITDIRMPKLDGLTLLKQIKLEQPHMDVIIVTGYGDINSSVEALRYGAANYILKPVNLEEMTMAVKNIEERQAMIKKLREQEARLAQARKMSDLGLVSAGVAHEINNPNTFIRGNLQVLNRFWSILEPFCTQAIKSGVNPPPKIDFIILEIPKILDALLHGTERIKMIVDSMATFTRLDSDASMAANLNECVLEIVTTKVSALNSIRVETLLTNDLPLIQASQDGLQEIVTELLNNSITAMNNSDNPMLTIRTEKISRDEVILIVEDNGVGIKPEHQSKIFTPFFSSTPKIGRPGLGLSKLYALVCSFGGEISFTSKENQGTAFKVKLPIAQPPKTKTPSESREEKFGNENPNS
ncbi:MAG: response regulator [Deltaproteobacteria bacterium]|nr:response regulator [Deltaproteobacteria bacterium]